MSNIQIPHYATLMPRLRMLLWGGAAVLFSIPVVAQIVEAEGFLWTIGDFVTAGVAILIAATVIDFGIRKADTMPYAIASAIAVGICFLTFWANGAVGIVGNEETMTPMPRFTASSCSRYSPPRFAIALRRGAPGAMARAMVACAIAQVVAGIIVALLGYFTLIFTGFMTGMWLLSAVLYRRAGRRGRCQQFAIVTPRDQMIPTALPLFSKMPRISLTCSLVCSAHSEQRSSVMLAGVAGGRARFT